MLQTDRAISLANADKFSVRSEAVIILRRHSRRICFVCICLSESWRDLVWLFGWLGSRVVSVLDSGAEGPGFKSQSRRCLRQTVHTHRASVHQGAKLVATLLRVSGVTAGLAESNGSLPPGLWLRSPVGWLPRTGISSGTLRSVIDYGLPLSFFTWCSDQSLAFLYVLHINQVWGKTFGLRLKFETLVSAKDKSYIRIV